MTDERLIELVKIAREEANLIPLEYQGTFQAIFSALVYNEHLKEQRDERDPVFKK